MNNNNFAGNNFLISIVIATYNWPEALRACVEACFRQDDRNIEIIIADDGSGEPTRALVEDLIRRSPVPMRHVWQPDDGFRLAESRNNGILAARGDYIIALDGDCVPQRDFIARHRQLAEAGYMVTGSRILLSQAFSARVLLENIDLQSLSLGEKLRYRLQGGLGKAAQLLLKLPDIGRRRHRFSFRRIKGCNMAFWRADLERINGFDESFRGWGYEDSDVVARLYHAGVMRKDGAYSTEIFHLWHREAQRDQASSNQHIVLERIRNGTTQAAIGLHEHANKHASAQAAQAAVTK
ncbi:MAG: glycosyl transferase family 2 [Massilia sp.]|nr:glycosyl transferase family 2 [Massilia sp.]